MHMQHVHALLQLTSSTADCMYGRRLRIRMLAFRGSSCSGRRRAHSTRCAKPQPHIARAARTARGTVGSKTTPCRSHAVYFSPRVSCTVGIGAGGCRAGPARSAPRCRPPRRACAVVSAGLLPARTPRGAEFTARTLRGEQASASSPCRFGAGCGSYDFDRAGRAR